MSVTSTLNGQPSFIFDVVYLCLLCITLGQCPQGKSGFCDHFPFWFIFPSDLPCSFLMISQVHHCFGEAFKFFIKHLYLFFSGRLFLKTRLSASERPWSFKIPLFSLSPHAEYPPISPVNCASKTGPQLCPLLPSCHPDNIPFHKCCLGSV